MLRQPSRKGRAHNSEDTDWSEITKTSSESSRTVGMSMPDNAAIVLANGRLITRNELSKSLRPTAMAKLAKHHENCLYPHKHQGMDPNISGHNRPHSVDCRHLAG